MSLENLPDEILIIIIKKLDLKSLSNLYCVCKAIHNIICTYRIIKTCSLSLNALAHVGTLNSSFFKDISRNLQELNMSGMLELYKTTLIPTLRLLKCLKKLDVTYTNIKVPDLIEICKACPTIKDIGVNYSYGRHITTEYISKIMPACQKVFANLSNVHFVCDHYIMFRIKLLNNVLDKAKLKKLQLTIYPTHGSEIYPYHLFIQNIVEGMEHESLCLYFMHDSCSHFFGISNHCILPIVRYSYMHQLRYLLFDVKYFETFIITYTSHVQRKMFKCYATPRFLNFFTEYSDISLDMIDFNIIGNSVDIFGDACIMQWKKSTTVFDKKFFIDLWCKLKSYIPYYFETICTTVPSPYDLYITNSTPKEIPEDDVSESGAKRRKISETRCVLNYDSMFSNKSKFKLFIMFKEINTVALTPDCEYLRKLTYLGLTGTVKYTLDFFQILFYSCKKLTTLIVYAPEGHQCCTSIAQYICLSQSIKNLLVYDKVDNFQILFLSMSLCRTLENVHIYDRCLESANVSSPLIMFKNCDNLYCLYIYASYRARALKINENTLKRAYQASKKQVNTRILPNDEYLVYDQYNNVFNINLIKYQV